MAFPCYCDVLICKLVVSAEQKVKVPNVHCDSRVKTVCADVMKLPEDEIRAFSPQVINQ